MKDAAEVATHPRRRVTARRLWLRRCFERRAPAGANERSRRRSSRRCASAGYERLAFDTIVASGPHAALPHYRAGDRILAAGDLVVLDFGGVLDGYCCDLTRTVSIGPPSPEARRLYTAVYDAHQAAIAAIRPGVESTAVDAAARTRPDGERPGRGVRPWHRARPRPRRSRGTPHHPPASRRPVRAARAGHGVHGRTRRVPGRLRRRADRGRRPRDGNRLRGADERAARAHGPVTHGFRRDHEDPGHDARTRAQRVRARARELQDPAAEARRRTLGRGGAAAADGSRGAARAGRSGRGRRRRPARRCCRPPTRKWSSRS